MFLCKQNCMYVCVFELFELMQRGIKSINQNHWEKKICCAFLYGAKYGNEMNSNGVGNGLCDDFN